MIVPKDIFQLFSVYFSASWVFFLVLTLHKDNQTNNFLTPAIGNNFHQCFLYSQLSWVAFSPSPCLDPHEMPVLVSLGSGIQGEVPSVPGAALQGGMWCPTVTEGSGWTSRPPAPGFSSLPSTWSCREQHRHFSQRSGIFLSFTTAGAWSRELRTRDVLELLFPSLRKHKKQKSCHTLGNFSFWGTFSVLRL